MFFGLIWSQTLKFSKLTENWYRDILLYSYFDFNAYFFKIFVSHIFLGKFWSQNLKFPKFTKFDAGGTLLCVYYDFNVYFFKKILSFT